MNTNHEYHPVFCILTSIFMFSTVMSDVCPDTSKVNFTIKCNFEDCHIPGEYCDRSDSDYYRCAKCDEDVCNGGNVPGECKIPCLGEYVIKKGFQNLIEKSQKEAKSIPTKKKQKQKKSTKT